MKNEIADPGEMTNNLPNDKGHKPRAPRKPRLLDEAPGKKYPYSIHSTMRTMRDKWYGPAGDLVKNNNEFAERSQFIATELKRKYPGNDSDKKIDLAGRIGRIYSSDQGIDYFDLRLFAENARVPTAVFYAFTHVLGDIARDGNQDNASNLLESMIGALSEIKAIIDSNKGDLKDVFRTPHHPENPVSTYEVNLEILRRASTAFRNLRVPRPDAEPVSLIG